MASQSVNADMTSRRSFASFPPETLRQIFSYFVPQPLPTDFKDREAYDCEDYGWKVPSDEDAAKRDTLRNLSLVSKACHAVARPLLYRNITIGTEVQALKLFFSMLMNEMGRHTRNFAFILLDDAVGEYTNPATFDAFQSCVGNPERPEIRRRVEQTYPHLLSPGINEDSIMSPHFMTHIIMLCAGMMPQGEDILLSLPRPNDDNFHPVEGLILPDMSRQDMQPIGPWKSVRFQAHTTFSRGTRDAAFLLLPFAAKATRIEFYDEYWHCQGLQEVIERGELQYTNVKQFEDINLHVGARDLSWLSTLLQEADKLKHLTLGLNYTNGMLPAQDLDSTLLPAMDKLESLSLYTTGMPGYDMPIMASLPLFSSLKNLAIDTNLLLGKVPVNNPEVPTISAMLPPNIQTLTLRERMYENLLLGIFRNSDRDVTRGYNKWIAEIFLHLLLECQVGVLPELRKVHLNVLDGYIIRRFERSLFVRLREVNKPRLDLHWSWRHHPGLHKDKRFRKPDNKWTNKPVEKAKLGDFRPDDACDCCN